MNHTGFAPKFAFPSRLSRYALSGVLLFATGLSAAGEATLFVMEDRNLRGSRPQVQHSRALISDTAVRVDSYLRSSSKPEASIIFHGDKDLLYIVQHGDREVARIEARALRAAAEHRRAMEKQMRQQLKGMAPQQRALAEQMMRGMGPIGAGVATEQRKTSRTDKVSGHECLIYETLRSGVVVREDCVNEGVSLGLSTNALDLLRRFSVLGADLGFIGDFGILHRPTKVLYTFSRAHFPGHGVTGL